MTASRTSGTRSSQRRTRGPMRIGSWLGVVVAAVAVVASTSALGASSDSAAMAQARGRTVADMPDDISGPQVHLLYVVPSDGADGRLDTNGGMEQSIARIERWLITQTRDQGMRIDTSGGVPDITFFRLPRTDAQAAATLYGPQFVIGEDLVAAGFNDPSKVYAVMYGGHGSSTCGAATSPALPKLAAAYLQGGTAEGAQICREIRGFGPGTNRAGFFEIVLLHEIMHVIGFSPPCAPHASKSEFPDHVNDSNRDLMYGPDATHPAGWDWANAVLDVNRDDYYRANVPGCRDLSNSPYLQATHSVSVKVSGPGTVTSNPAGIDCPGSCTAMFARGAALIATPHEGAIFRSWTGACSGTGACMATGGSVSAAFSALSHRRTLTLRVRAQRATGALGVVDSYRPCRVHVPVVVDRRGKHGWSTVRRLRTDSAGLFALAIPRGPASYRARAPRTTASGHQCFEAVSRTVVASG